MARLAFDGDHCTLMVASVIGIISAYTAIAGAK